MSESSLPSGQRALTVEINGCPSPVLRDMQNNDSSAPPSFEVDYEGRGSRRLEAELKRIVQDAGEVIFANLYEPAKGGGWAAVISTEYAALKIYFQYRHSNVHLVHDDKGWIITVRSP